MTHRIRQQRHQDKPRSDCRRLIVLGCTLGFLLFGVFGVWASTVPLSGAVVAVGVVKVISKRKAVQHLEGGIIKSILVHEGDYVNAGQLLAQLDTAQIEAQLGVFESKLFADLALEARLEAEQKSADKVTFPEELLGSDRREARTAIQTQLEEFKARKTAIEGMRNQIDQQILQLADAIKGIESNTEGIRQQLEYLREQMKDTEYLLEKGLARKPMLLALKRSEAEAEATIARNGFAVAEAKGKFGELQDRRRQFSYDRTAEIAKQSHLNRAEMADLRHRIAALREKLEQTEIRAPESGTVVGLNTRDIDSVLSPRQTLLEIVPHQDRLSIEVQLKPIDRDEVHVGQVARIRVLAFNARRNPMLSGKVTMIGADTVLDPRTNPILNDPRKASVLQQQLMIPGYKSEVELDKNAEMAKYIALLKPGMPVEVFIETRERTFAQYIMQPLLLSVDRAFREN
jgi:HlyD family type I secretion membrane fusion protein